MQTMNCKNCGAAFVIEDRDLKFYEKMQVPGPTHCPECRLQRRLAWRVERNLYFRNCDLTGKRSLSVFPPEAPYKVYSYDAWHSDTWNAKNYGRDFDFNRPFFEQFAELMRAVPLLAVNAMANQNCDFVNQCGWSKNCYFTIEADMNEDCLYGYRVFFNKTSLDFSETVKSERVYECIDCDKCFNLKFSQLCRQCSDSEFLFDCRGCMNCFGCTGLRNKQFCWFNEQLSPEEYRKRRAAFDFCNPEQVREAAARFETLKLQHPRKALTGEMNENVSGNYIFESKDCLDSYNIRGCRDMRYCHMVRSSKDCMDYFVWGEQAERIYESECCGVNISNLAFCCDCWDGSRDLRYCFQCIQQTSNCFGCIGLKRSSYCILNKQYSREEYEALLPRIIEYMKKTGELGEFFSAEMAPYAYNETVAHEYFPLEKEAALAKGLTWRDNLPFTKGKETIPWDRVPLNIAQVPETITNEILACEATGRNFRITGQELRLYREMKLPIPHLHPDERHRRRMLMRNPRALFRRACGKCSTEIQTTYSPERPEKVYCEQCYLKEVY